MRQNVTALEVIKKRAQRREHGQSGNPGEVAVASVVGGDYSSCHGLKHESGVSLFWRSLRPEVRQLAEDLKARVNFLARKILQALRAKALHRKRAHHSAIEQRALEHFPVDLSLRCDVSHESAGKGIARTSRILYLIDGKRGRAKRMRSDAEGAFTEENRCAVFAVLDDQRLRPQGQNLIRGAQQILLVREHPGFGVVDQQHIDQLQRLRQFFRGAAGSSNSWCRRRSGARHPSPAALRAAVPDGYSQETGIAYQNILWEYAAGTFRIHSVR